MLKSMELNSDVQIACPQGHDLVKFLKQNNVEINATDFDGNTVLMHGSYLNYLNYNLFLTLFIII